jgi:hypothetical protein
LQANIEYWSQYPALTDVLLTSGTGISPTVPFQPVILRADTLVQDSLGGYGSITLNSVGFASSSIQEFYAIANNQLITGNVSSLGIIRNGGNEELSTASLYLSSLYLGSLGGKQYGQLTTDATASDIYWNGVSLTAGGGGTVSPADLVSTVVGLGTSKYVSTATLIDAIDTAITSTTQGLIEGIIGVVDSLGDFGYVSSSQLASTTEFFQTAGFLSSPNLLNLVSTSFLNTSLASTTQFFQTAGFVSAPNLLNLVSTPFLATTLNSSIRGLGSAGYLSSINISYPANFSVSALFVSSISATVIQTAVMSSAAIFASSLFAPYVFLPQFFTF